MPSSSFCCRLCGCVHTSLHTALDTFCPECYASRAEQQLLTCYWCAMPVEYIEDRRAWLHCDSFQGHGLLHIPRVQPVVGMHASVNTGRGRIPVRVSHSTGAFLLLEGGGMTLEARADVHGDFYPPKRKRIERWRVHFLNKAKE